MGTGGDSLMKKILLWITVGIVMLILASLFITTTVYPPNDTRVILEYTDRTYIAPPCFEQADPTNNIGEADLGAARNINFSAHDTCTEKELQSEEKSLFISFLEKIGLLHSKWEDWE